MEVNETDFSAENAEFFKIRGEYLKAKFESRNLPCHLVQNGEDVKPFISDFITGRPHIKDIAFSDGVTLYELNLFEWIEKEYVTSKMGGGVNTL